MPAFAQVFHSRRVRLLLCGLLLAVVWAGGTASRAEEHPPDPAPQAQPPAGEWEGRLLGTLDRIDPSDPASRAAGGDGRAPLTPRQQLLLCILLAAATLASEDLTCVAAGLLASHGKLSLVAAIFACMIGIFVG